MTHEMDNDLVDFVKKYGIEPLLKDNHFFDKMEQTIIIQCKECLANYHKDFNHICDPLIKMLVQKKKQEKPQVCPIDPAELEGCESCQ